jgi:hypothetical protein
MAEALRGSRQYRAEEWMVVADDIDYVDVDIGRNGSSPLAAGYEQSYGERGVDWRVVEKPLEHNSLGAFAKAVGLIPVKVEASVDALERQKKDMIYGVNRADFYEGLLKIG